MQTSATYLLNQRRLDHSNLIWTHDFKVNCKSDPLQKRTKCTVEDSMVQHGTTFKGEYCTLGSSLNVTYTKLAYIKFTSDWVKYFIIFHISKQKTRQYQTVKMKSLPRPVWSHHSPVSSDQVCRGSDQRPPCQSVQLSVPTITAPTAEGKNQLVIRNVMWPAVPRFTSSEKPSFLAFKSIYPVKRVSDGRATLELCGPRRYVFSTQAEVMVGGLYRQRRSSLPSFFDKFQWFCRGQVNNVTSHPGAQKQQFSSVWTQPNP